MKKTVVYLFLFLAVLFLFENCNVTTQTPTIQSTYALNNVLVDYGKSIYQREQCSNCHTQEIGKEGYNQISLDGFGGKYSNAWIYFLLENPQNVTPESKMSSFSHLLKNPLDKEYLIQLLKNKKVDIDAAWIELNKQAVPIANDLELQYIPFERKTEILALIAYLQQIPATKSKVEADSIADAKRYTDFKAWANSPLDSTGIIFKEAQNKDNVAKGELLFNKHCVACHGSKAAGLIGPNLTDEYWLHGKEVLDIAKTIANGVPSKGMITWRYLLKPTQVGEIIAYISSLKGTNPPNAKEPQGEK